METPEIKFNNLEVLATEFTEAVAQRYREYLIRDGKGDSKLVKNIEVQDDSLLLPDYWKFVEYGRRPGKFPPPTAIEDWVKRKGIRFPGATYLISRSIAKHGIQAGHQLGEAITNVAQEFNERFNQALTKDISDYLSKNIKLQ